jgi:hypothetical protein
MDMALLPRRSSAGFPAADDERTPVFSSIPPTEPTRRLEVDALGAVLMYGGTVIRVLVTDDGESGLSLGTATVPLAVSNPSGFIPISMLNSCVSARGLASPNMTLMAPTRLSQMQQKL